MDVPGPRRRLLLISAAIFLVFGVTDWCELGSGGRFPLWLWGVKIACGAGIFVCRYTWRGWHTLRWHDREVLFAAACLLGVAIILAIQASIPAPATDPAFNNPTTSTFTTP